MQEASVQQPRTPAAERKLQLSMRTYQHPRVQQLAVQALGRSLTKNISISGWPLTSQHPRVQQLAMQALGGQHLAHARQQAQLGDRRLACTGIVFGSRVGR